MSIPNKDVKQTKNNAEPEDSAELKKAESSGKESAMQQNANDKESIGKKTVSNHQNSNKKNKKMNAQHQSNKNHVKKGTQENVSTTKEVQPKLEKKSGGKGIALLALLVALGVGGTGYYLGMQRFNNLEGRIDVVEKSVVGIDSTSSNTANALSMKEIEQKIESFKTLVEEKLAIVTQLNGASSTDLGNVESAQTLKQKLIQLEEQQKSYIQQLAKLDSQFEIMKSGYSQDKSLNTVMSDTRFLLKNAQRKLTLDSDLETAKNLLMDADKLLVQFDNPKILEVKQAIQSDLQQLSNIKEVDQDALMLKLTALVNSIDDMPILNLKDIKHEESTDVSDSINDWETNVKNSAVSFLNHFIRISDDKVDNKKLFIAPNQEAYLRENLRLRLQIATLAIPRQQDELYKESLKTVANWVRSYFDIENGNVKVFLTQLDQLAQQSLYIDIPQQLKSLDLLKNLQVPSKQVVAE